MNRSKVNTWDATAWEIEFQSLFSWMNRSKAAKFRVFSAKSQPNRLKFPQAILPAKLLIPI